MSKSEPPAEIASDEHRLKLSQLKEAQCLNLFQRIDKGQDNAIHLSELLESVREAGMTVSSEQVASFLNHIDSDKDGIIEYGEWREFLLQLPLEPTLNNIFDYYATVSSVDFNSDVYTFPQGLFSPHFMFRIKYFIAGGFAGAVSRSATAPLDRLRVYLQTQTLASNKSQLTLISEAVSHIYKSGGILSFYRGNGLNVIKIFPESALKFYLFEYAKELLVTHGLAQDKESIPLFGRFLAGGLAGLVSQFAIYPIETLKTRLMSQISNDVEFKGKQKTILETARNLYRENGIKAFYRGSGPALIGIIPYAGIDLAVFETLKMTYLNYLSTTSPKPNYEKHTLSTPVILAFGMISGSCGAMLMYPLSLIRTRLQAQGTPSHPATYPSAWAVVKSTIANEGVIGFYKGIGPTLVKVLPAVSISYVVYENCKRGLGIA